SRRRHTRSTRDWSSDVCSSDLIVGHSLLTARGIPCAGEGDLKTAVAMKICDILGAGGSFSEIVVVDYVDETILLGHDGPFHIAKIGRASCRERVERTVRCSVDT